MRKLHCLNVAAIHCNNQSHVTGGPDGSTRTGALMVQLERRQTHTHTNTMETKSLLCPTVITEDEGEDAAAHRGAEVEVLSRKPTTGVQKHVAEAAVNQSVTHARTHRLTEKHRSSATHTVTLIACLESIHMC